MDRVGEAKGRERKHAKGIDRKKWIETERHNKCYGGKRMSRDRGIEDLRERNRETKIMRD